MKSKLLALVMCLMVSSAFAKKPQFEEWRSTEIAGAFVNFMVATGSIHIEEITVTSGSVGASSFYYYNSSNTNLSLSTASYQSSQYNTSTTGSRWIVKDQLSRGFLFTSSGTANVKVLWDWISGPPCYDDNFTDPTQIKKGLK